MILLTIKSRFNEILTFFAYYRAHMFACINLITKILIPSLTPRPHYSCCALINKSFPTAINMAKLIFYIYTIEREWDYIKYISQPPPTPQLHFMLITITISAHTKKGMKMRAVNNNNTELNQPLIAFSLFLDITTRLFHPTHNNNKSEKIYSMPCATELLFK